MEEASRQNWSTRALERQVNTSYYERLLSSSDRPAVEREAHENLSGLKTPRDLVRDPVLLEFLGLPGTGKLLEADLERRCSTTYSPSSRARPWLRLRRSPVSDQHRVQRLLCRPRLLKYLLKCFVLFELKTGELTHQDIGQMDMYVRMMDDLKRARDDNPTVVIILCTQKDASVVRYSVLQGNEQIFASRYRLVLPSEDELRAELERERNQLTIASS